VPRGWLLGGVQQRQKGVGAMSISHLKADKKKGLRNLPFKVKIPRRRYGQKDIIKYFAARKEAELFEAAEKLKLEEKKVRVMF
jgi:hypothetical protein